MILVTGTGRSGTRSLHRQLEAAGLDSAHEPGAPAVMVAAAWWNAGGINTQAAVDWLNHVTMARDANCFWAYCTLIRPLTVMFPDATWVWSIRNARDTVASMCARRWWEQSDDDGWPIMLSWPDGEQIWTSTPWRCRPNGFMFGDMSWPEWQSLPQVGRACWWWGHVYQTMREQPCLRYRVECQQPDLLLEALGLPECTTLYTDNVSPVPPPAPEDIDCWLDRFCAEGMADLYAGWDGTGRRVQDGPG